jgi:hypothetical protein
MSRNNILQNALALLDIDFDEALAADIATLNIEGMHMVHLYIIAF